LLREVGTCTAYINFRKLLLKKIIEKAKKDNREEELLLGIDIFSENILVSKKMFSLINNYVNIHAKFTQN
jgi:hypothetical protein